MRGAIVDWLRARTGELCLDHGCRSRDRAAGGFDLSVGSPLLSGDSSQNDAEPLTRRLFERMREQGALIGVNGYDEARVFYTSPAFAGKRPLDETRTMHMAIDLTLPAGAPVYAPLAGTVHGFMEATDRLDYGPVIVLKHDADGVPFYTLYGHLGRASLDGLTSASRSRPASGWAGWARPRSMATGGRTCTFS